MKIRNKAAWKKEPYIIWIYGGIVLLVFISIAWFYKSPAR